MRIDLFSGGREALVGELFEAFTEPIELGRCASILERQNDVDFLWSCRCRRGVGCRRGLGC